MSKRYLGDGVYADHDGWHIVLTTEDGTRETNVIYIEPLVLAELEHFIAEVKKHMEGGNT